MTGRQRPRTSRKRGTLLACGAFALLLAGIADAIAAETEQDPTIHEFVEYQDIRGSTQQALVSALDRLSQADPSGDRFYANTHWELRWNFRVGAEPGERCRLTSATTDLTIRMSLPRWKAPRKAPRELVQRWNRFATALRNHEDGHRDIAIAAAHEISDKAYGAPAASGCAALKRTLGHIANATLDEYREKEHRYDTDTQHGRTQGATFP